MKEKLIIIRNFLYKLFLIGFVINILFQMFIMLFVGQHLLTASRILELPPYYLTELLITSIATIRVFLIYFILCPALALHWTIAKDKILNKES